MNETNDTIAKSQIDSGNMAIRKMLADHNHRGLWVAIYASDWGIYHEQLSADYEFDCTRGWILGVVVRQTEAIIAVAHQVFNDDAVRHVTVIPVENIRKLAILEPRRES